MFCILLFFNVKYWNFTSDKGGGDCWDSHMTRGKRTITINISALIFEIHEKLLAEYPVCDMQFVALKLNWLAFNLTGKCNPSPQIYYLNDFFVCYNTGSLAH